MYLRFGYNQNKIIQKIKGYRYVSFDIYDTLIKRDICRNVQIFKLIETVLKRDGSVFADGFCENRVRAEQEARVLASRSEISLHDIYDCYIYCGDKISEKDKNDLIEREIDIEIKISTVNNKILEVMKYCKSSGKKIILISDMYHSCDTLVKILNENGLKKGATYDEIFVSSEYNKSKYTGELYEEVLKQLKISPKDIIHIGDAKRSDYVIPKMKGIEAIHIPADDIKNHFQFYKDNKSNRETYDLIDKFQGNRLPLGKDEYYIFGYECLGILLFSFCRWLHSLINTAKEKTLFLSREGQLLQRAYNIMYPTEDTEYIYVSRKSLIAGLLWKCNDIQARLRSLSLQHVFDTTTLFELLNLQNHIEDIGEIKQYFSVQDVIEDSEIMQQLAEYDSEIIEKSKEQFHYLADLFIDSNQEVIINLVDIGWKGTMQNCLSLLLKETGCDAKVIGYYMGISRSGIKSFGNTLERKGFLFDSSFHESKIDENDVFSFGGLLECLFTADHGSVKRYQEIDGNIEPILYQHEMENKQEYGYLRAIQDGAMDFVKDYTESILSMWMENDCIVAFSKLRRFGNYPNRRDIKIFEEFDFFDIKASKMCGTEKWYKCLGKPKKIKEDFLSCGWKVGCIKKNSFLIPAHWMYSFARSRQNE